MATMKDVAERAGVAVETVSRVLNNRGYISEKTRRKVYDAMDELSYSPNIVARGLSKKDMNSIAIVVPHVVHPYFAKVISRLEKECTKRHYTLFLYNSSGDSEKESNVLALCQNSFATGVVLFSSDINPSALKKFHIPIITVERYIEGGTSTVMVDNELGGELAAQHLVERGCRNILFLGTNLTSDMPGDNREKGFVGAAAKAGVTCSIYRGSENDFDSMEYYAFIQRALSENPDVDGIFATSDLVAAKVIQVCSRIGKSIPGDIKLIGFDDVELARLTNPTLTTIHQPLQEMAAKVLDLIEDARAGRAVPERTIMPVSLVERESTQDGIKICH
ncbi:transcriptional regulator, LacI family [Lachnospiraceae bacterium NK3A20]|nr:transcriptional regulator, LacI family [Lachnospiraceae bacterium NK3A20]